MTIQSALKEGYLILCSAEVQTPLLDSTVLLAEALGVTKERLFASFIDTIDEKEFISYKKLLEKRCKGTPVSYIRNKKEFFGLEFYVDERVLVPRPDTETVVETVLSILDSNPGIKTIHDACTGSGCIAISLKKKRPWLSVTASDISPDAGDVFSINCRQILNDKIPFVCSDLLQNIHEAFTVIVANPPYLSENELEEMRKIKWPEPESALLGGQDGLSVSQRLIREASSKINAGGFLVMESCPQHMKNLSQTMEESGFSDISIWQDLGHRDRVISGRLMWKQ